MRRHKALLAVSLLARMGAGLASLLFLARALGPADYGLVATIFAYGAIVALVTDFGFSIKLLRDVGAQPQRAGELVAACFRVKTLLLCPASTIMLGVLIWRQPPPDVFLASVLLYLAVIVLSYGDLALVALRALGRYGTETGVVLVGMAGVVLMLGATAFAAPALLPLSVTLLAARLVQVALSLLALGRIVALENCIWGPVAPTARESLGLAGDTILTALSGQIDVIFVSALLGLHATGVYQVAARASAYALLPSQLLAGVYTPALSASHFAARAQARQLEARMRIEFPILGAVCAAFVIAVLPLLAPWLFGRAFHVPMDVWVGFGAMVLVRFSIGALGIALVARRAVRARLVGQSLGAVTLCLGMVILLPQFGVAAAPWVAVGATLVTAAIYLVALAASPQAITSSQWPVTALATRAPR